MATIKGGDALAGYLDQIEKRLTNATSVEIGWPFNDTYPDSGTSVPMVAAIQEFGAPGKGIPPRPYFRTMINKHSPEWPVAIAESLVDTKYDAKKTLDQLGLAVSGQLSQSIVDTNSPPLSPITVMLRGMRSQAKYRDLPFWERFAIAKDRVANNQTNYGASTKPLVDTGQMIDSIKHVVK